MKYVEYDRCSKSGACYHGCHYCWARVLWWHRLVIPDGNRGKVLNDWKELNVEKEGEFWGQGMQHQVYHAAPALSLPSPFWFMHRSFMTLLPMSSVLIYTACIGSTHLKAWRMGAARNTSDPVNNLLLPFVEKSEEMLRCARVRDREEELDWASGTGKWERAPSFHCFIGVFIYFLENTANLIVHCL